MAIGIPTSKTAQTINNISKSQWKDGYDSKLSSLLGISSLCNQVAEVRAKVMSLSELLAEMMASTGDKNGDEDARELVEEIEGEISCLEKGLWLLSNMLV